MLVLPGYTQGVFTALGARVATGYDSSIPRQGVEVYSIDQRESVCDYPSNGACSGPNRRTRPNPPAEAGAGYGDTLYSRGGARLVEHVRRPGDVFEVGRATIEGTERVGNNYLVRVVDPGNRPGIDPDWVETAFGMTAAEAQVTALLAEGRSVRDITAITRYQESYVRWLFKEISVDTSLAYTLDEMRSAACSIADGRISVAPLVQGTVTPDELPQTIDDLATRRNTSIKLLVDPTAG